MTQYPKYPISLKADLAGLDTTMKYELQVRMWGNEANSCQNTGAEFNPLIDPSEIPVPVWTGYSYVLPPSDYYGEILPFTPDADGTKAIEQMAFMQNLEGPQTLIGRSIALV